MVAIYLFPPTGAVLTLDTTDSDFQKMFDVALFGTLNVTRAFIRPMIEKRSGSVVAVSAAASPMLTPTALRYRSPARRANSHTNRPKRRMTALFGYLAAER